MFSGGEGGAAGAGVQPPYHLHLAGVELAGGRGHGELDLLAVLGVHGGRVYFWVGLVLFKPTKS